MGTHTVSAEVRLFQTTCSDAPLALNGAKESPEVESVSAAFLEKMVNTLGTEICYCLSAPALWLRVSFAVTFLGEDRDALVVTIFALRKSHNTTTCYL